MKISKIVYEKTRLDRFLKEQFPHRSRESFKKILPEIQIFRKNLTLGKIKPSTLLLENDEVSFEVSQKPEPEIDPTVRTLYEDEWILIVSKSGNIPVHPSGKFIQNTLLSILSKNKNLYLTHRIDRETSGIVILAKDKKTCGEFTKLFMQKKIQKTYVALVHGKLQSKHCNEPLERTKTHPIKVKMEIDPNGLPSETFFETIETRILNLSEKNLEISLIKAFPKTGRQHQIRAHLAHLGNPIVGDKLYSLKDPYTFEFYEISNNKRTHIVETIDGQTIRRAYSKEILDLLLLKRHALHAHEIEFTHPMSLKKIKIQDPLPKELEDFFRQSC